MTIFCDKIIQPSPPTQLSGVSEPPFLPLHSLPLRLQLRSRSLRAQKAATLTLSIPSAFRHQPPAPPHIPTPQAEARSLPAEKRPQAPRPASRPEPCSKGRAASAVRLSSLRRLRPRQPHRCPSRTPAPGPPAKDKSQPHTSKPIKHHCIFPRRLYNTYPNRQSHISHKLFSLITQPFTTSAILEYFSVHQYFSKKDLVYNINQFIFVQNHKEESGAPLLFDDFSLFYKVFYYEKNNHILNPQSYSLPRHRATPCRYQSRTASTTPSPHVLSPVIPAP